MSGDIMKPAVWPVGNPGPHPPRPRKKAPVSGLREALDDLLHDKALGLSVTVDDLLALLAAPEHRDEVRALWGEVALDGWEWCPVMGRVEKNKPWRRHSPAADRLCRGARHSAVYAKKEGT